MQEYQKENRNIVKMVITIVLGVLFGIFLIHIDKAHSADITPYTRIGGMELVEQGISEGHKVFYMLGVDVSKQFIDYEWTFTAEGFVMGEAVDEDPELIHNGFRLGAQSKLLTGASLSPFIAVNYEQWNRDANQKYTNSFTSLDFLDVLAGVSYEKGHLYSRIGALYPFYSSEFDGGLGFDAGIGIKFDRLRIGYSYKRVKFSDVTSNFSAAEISYKF